MDVSLRLGVFCFRFCAFQFRRAWRAQETGDQSHIWVHWKNNDLELFDLSKRVIALDFWHFFGTSKLSYAYAAGKRLGGAQKRSSLRLPESVRSFEARLKGELRCQAHLQSKKL
jgi:hypothetical protein